jgi:hypothetical protein
MWVWCGDLDSLRSQCVGNLRHFRSDEGEVSGDGHLAGAEGLEVDHCPDAEGGRELDLAALLLAGSRGAW